MPFRFYLLGPPEIRRGDEVLPRPATRKAQSLLAYLLCNRRRRHPRDVLAGMFWGDRPESKARRSLATAVWHARRSLSGADIIRTDRRAVRIAADADIWIDVAAFEELAGAPDLEPAARAADLYRGDFMDGFFDDWVINERHRLESLLFDVLARLMAGHEAREEYDVALATAQRLLMHDPLREDAHRLAMRAHCRIGQRNAALEQYERCRETLKAELGVEPMAETMELYEDILAGRIEVPSAREIVHADVPTALRPMPTGRSPLDLAAPGPLVSREEEMDLLQACWQAAQTGQGRLVLILGEAGVGKTRLVESFADRLRWQGNRIHLRER